ncbi:MAG: hypothetical protein ACFB15_29465 [Cyclobacteriaceae bacterium]
MKKVAKSLFALVLTTSLLLTACGGEEPEGTESSDDMVSESTNPDGQQPLELSVEFETVEKRILIASLMRQRNDLQYRIQEIKSAADTTINTASPAGDLEQLQTYVDSIDKEIANVRNTPSENLREAEETAMAAIEEAGALLQSSYMRIDSGF